MSGRLKMAVILAAAVLLGCIVFFIFFPEDNILFKPIEDALFIVFGLAAGITGIYTFRKLGWRSKEGKVWLLLALGFLGWAVGEFLWLYNEVILEIEPFPSTADIAYLLAYIPLIIGLWIEYNIIKEAIVKKGLMKAVILTSIISIISAYFVLVPIITATDYDLLSKIVSLSYPIGDLLILFPALIFIFVFKGAKMSRSWLFIAIALLLEVIADSSFAYLDWNELYSGTYLILTDLAWLAGYALFAFGAYYHSLIIKGEA
ncbi:MAG: hypothetical protein KKD17_02645 [Nanoarchaeota archaeon]|nr:hypothetical protein [Nanoarchaeota archaeon]